MEETRRVARQYLITFVILCAIFVTWALIDTLTLGFQTRPLKEVVDPPVFNPNDIRAPLTPSPRVTTATTR